MREGEKKFRVAFSVLYPIGKHVFWSNKYYVPIGVARLRISSSTYYPYCSCPRSNLFFLSLFHFVSNITVPCSLSSANTRFFPEIRMCMSSAREADIIMEYLFNTRDSYFREAINFTQFHPVS